MLHGDKKAFLEDNFDFIQKHIREYSLQYGASVIFTSATANRNTNVLYQYILHRMFGFNMKFKSEVIEKENLFVPAGFDSPTLIQELVKGNIFTSPSGEPLLYEEVIVRLDYNS